MLKYGPITMGLICEAIRSSFKLFWDGSISMYHDTFLSSENNKDALQDLLNLRRETNGDKEPPVTFMHGTETEKFLRSTLLVMKNEETKAVEARQRAAMERKNQLEEEEEEEDEHLDMGEESEEKLTTFQQDLDMITDFSCFKSTEFTTKVMQGVNLRCLLRFDEHQKPSYEQVKEELSILDDI